MGALTQVGRPLFRILLKKRIFCFPARAFCAILDLQSATVSEEEKRCEPSKRNGSGSAWACACC